LPGFRIGFAEKIDRFSAEGGRVLGGHAMRIGRIGGLEVLVSWLNRQKDQQSNPLQKRGQVQFHKKTGPDPVFCLGGGKVCLDSLISGFTVGVDSAQLPGR
jgi:hypothetical protein